MIKLTKNGKVFGVETDWSQCLEETDFTSSDYLSIGGLYYIDSIEVTKEHFEIEYKRSGNENHDIKVGYETVFWVEGEE